MATTRRRTVCLAAWLLLALGALGGAGCGSAPRETLELSARLEPIRKKHDLPALAAVTLDASGIRAAGCAGVRRAGSDSRVTLEDEFHLGSCTKAMTATLCALLVEEQKLRWDSTLEKVFPDLAPTMHRDYRGVTLEQLLTHRGGVPADLSADGLWARLWNFEGTPTAARRALLEGVVARAPAFTPGTQCTYSNGGYAIAGHMAETLTGTSWEDLLRARIFRPLGMASAGFGAPGESGSLDQPRGHDASGKPVEPGRGADNPVAIGPAGTVHASLGDWARFVGAHLRGANGDTALLARQSMAKLHAPSSGGGEFAMGWISTTRSWSEGRVLTHAGSNTLWYCVVWLAPAENFAVLVACNRGGPAAEKACDEAAWDAIQEMSKSKK